MTRRIASPLAVLTDVLGIVEYSTIEARKNVRYALSDARAMGTCLSQVLALYVAPKRLVRRWTR